MERRKHYWNGKWGRLARMDILVFEDAGAWLIEARSGGADGRSRWFQASDADAALDRVRDLITLSKMDSWREL